MNHFDHPADLATPPRPRGPLLGARLVERRPDSCADFESQAHRDEPAWPAWLVAVLIAAAIAELGDRWLLHPRNRIR